MSTVVDAKFALGDPNTIWCSVVGAAACAAIPFLELTLPDFEVSHGWLFLIGIAAFASNLAQPLQPWLRGVAALAQAVCAFEIFGFSVGLTVLAFAAVPVDGSPPLWTVALGWVVVGSCTVAVVGAAQSVLRSLAVARPE